MISNFSRFSRKHCVIAGVFFLVFITTSVILLTTTPGKAQNGTTSRELAPLGYGTDAIAELIERIGITDDASVTITILPVTFPPHPENITVAERKDLLERADSLRSEINDQCLEIHSGQSVCSVYVAPILVRSDANNSQYLEPFRRPNDVIYIPDGNPVIAMGVIGGTPVEEKLIEAYQNGVTIAAYGRSVALLSSAMLAGRTEELSNNPPLSFGYANVWNSAEKHGLIFGTRSAIINESPFSLDHLSTLLGAVAQPDSPHLGVSVEETSGFILSESDQIETVLGSSGILILDAETYNSSDSVRYTGCKNNSVVVLPCSPFFSLRNVLVHSIGLGDTTYSLSLRSHSLINPPPSTNREFNSILLPSAAGTLLVSGHDINHPEQSPALVRFGELVRASGSRVLIYADGFFSSSRAGQIAENYASLLGFEHHLIVTDADRTRSLDLPSGSEYDGIIFIAEDISVIKPQMAPWMEEQWLSGKPILVEGAAVQIIGPYFYAELDEAQSSVSPLKADSIDLGSGLRFLDVNFSVTQTSNYEMNWRSLFKLAINAPEFLSIGIPSKAAIEISAQGAEVLGENTIAVLDFRSARITNNMDDYKVFANGFIDIFTPGEQIQAQSADSSVSFSPLPTPALISPTPTTTSTVTPTQPPPSPTPTEKPTKTPRPTSTPPIIPPPSNPEIDQWMIAFGVVIVIVIIFGVLISRQ
jgi:cyanophycinase-like exopeptidase